MIDWLQKPSTLIWGIYLAAAELCSNFPSYSFSCILVSDEDHAKDYSGNQPCATVHEAVFRFSKFIWVNANHDNISAFAAVAVAVFTFTLWQSTLKLWEIGEKQIAVAKESADAAKLSADAAIDSNKLTMPNNDHGLFWKSMGGVRLSGKIKELDFRLMSLSQMQVNLPPLMFGLKL